LFFLYEYRSRLNERELKMTEKSSFSIFLGKSIGISALLLGFLNICGMFISFFHLRRFGIFEISFFQIQYIFVGFIFVLILIAPILIFIVLAAIAEKKTNTLSKILELSIVGLLAAITFIYILLFFFYGDFEWNWILTRFGQVIKFGNIIWLLYAWLFYATGKSLIDDLTKIKRKEILPSRELWIPTVFLLTLFILFFTILRKYRSSQYSRFPWRRKTDSSGNFDSRRGSLLRKIIRINSGYNSENSRHFNHP